MKPIRRPDTPKPTPPAPARASLRLQLRTGKLSQAESSQEEVDQREPDALFEPMDPATRGNQ